MNKDNKDCYNEDPERAVADERADVVAYIDDLDEFMSLSLAHLERIASQGNTSAQDFSGRRYSQRRQGMAKKKTVKFLGVEYSLEDVQYSCLLKAPFGIGINHVGFIAMTSEETDRRFPWFEHMEGLGKSPQAAAAALEKQMLQDFRDMAEFLGYTVEG